MNKTITVFNRRGESVEKNPQNRTTKLTMFESITEDEQTLGGIDTRTLYTGGANSVLGSSKNQDGYFQRKKMSAKVK